jgi:biopolymer transport protein TolR
MAFGRLERTKGSEPMSDINMTPLVDVMLVLVVIFILTAPLMSSSIRLNLPQADAAKTQASPQFVSLVVDKTGQAYLNDRKIELPALALQLAQLAAQDPDTEVQLRADTTVPYGRVVEVMGVAQAAGLGRIGFVAQPTATATSP